MGPTQLQYGMCVEHIYTISPSASTSSSSYITLSHCGRHYHHRRQTCFRASKVVMAGGRLRPNAWGMILRNAHQMFARKDCSGDPRVVTRGQFFARDPGVRETTGSGAVRLADYLGKFFQRGETGQDGRFCEFSCKLPSANILCDVKG